MTSYLTPNFYPRPVRKQPKAILLWQGNKLCVRRMSIGRVLPDQLQQFQLSVAEKFGLQQLINNEGRPAIHEQQLPGYVKVIQLYDSKEDLALINGLDALLGSNKPLIEYKPATTRPLPLSLAFTIRQMVRSREKRASHLQFRIEGATLSYQEWGRHAVSCVNQQEVWLSPDTLLNIQAFLQEEIVPLGDHGLNSYPPASFQPVTEFELQWTWPDGQKHLKVKGTQAQLDTSLSHFQLMQLHQQLKNLLG